MKKKLTLILWLAMILFCISSCKKSFLDAKPNSNILEPTTLSDFQSLLENTSAFLSPALPTLSADEYEYFSYATYQSTSTLTEKNAFIWSKDIYAGAPSVADWNSPYTTVFYANSVLTGLKNLEATEPNQFKLNYLKGWALFDRAFAYYDLVDSFSPVYDPATAQADLGVPLKLNPSIDDLEPRASVQQTFDQILSDLNTSIPLLVTNIPQVNREQPSKVAGFALLARIYLNMRNYNKAESAADSSLNIYKTLINYNTVSTTSNAPFTSANNELIFYKSSVSYSAATTFINSHTTIDSSLLKLYSATDIRAQVYFLKRPTGAIVSKEQYGGNTTLYPFTGLAVDELYLIKAECAARRNDLPTALQYLNQLLVNRYKTGTYIAYSSALQSDVLNKILLERRKELVWRNLRWDDIKRLNKEGAGIVLQRNLNGQNYLLPPNDPRYVFPIPDNEIQLSGIKQNNR